MTKGDQTLSLERTTPQVLESFLVSIWCFADWSYFPGICNMLSVIALVFHSVACEI